MFETTNQIIYKWVIYGYLLNSYVSLLEGPASGLRPYQVANSWLHDAGPLVIDGWERHNLLVPQQVRQGHHISWL